MDAWIKIGLSATFNFYSESLLLSTVIVNSQLEGDVANGQLFWENFY